MAGSPWLKIQHFVLSTLRFEGEKGAHGGDHGLPDGDGRGQGGQMAVGEVQGEQKRHGGR